MENLERLKIEQLPNRIIKIGETLYAEEFFRAIDDPDPLAIYRMERINGVTRITKLDREAVRDVL